MIVADTNVVSEFMRDAPLPTVLAWAETVPADDLGMCVVTVEEIERGLGRLPQGRRRRDLERRWFRLVDRYAENVALYDVEAARRAAAVLVAAEASGRPMSLADAQIAGICLAGGHRLATRNTRDFSAVEGLALLDPFGH
ncbi:PIN domain-containing protein [Phycicoccus flavus]|uniref:PIN domain-containing protein n=1 Tax=Phycicoccus flavus TaxID=2502783 RepID=UPI000FEB91C6|nr:PIN domain-containing protein [Phycicoccus flavus]NHA69297.1 type II toxin-antitoxin system VapC family toxin [Phycicoccus flavus]